VPAIQQTPEPPSMDPFADAAATFEAPPIPLVEPPAPPTGLVPPVEGTPPTPGEPPVPKEAPPEAPPVPGATVPPVAPIV